MKQTRILMGMPITVEIRDDKMSEGLIGEVYEYFKYVEEKFSTYKKNSEISRFNRSEVDETQLSDDMKEVLKLSEETKRQTGGYFNIVTRDGTYDTSGLVKGWAIFKAALLLKQRGCAEFYVEAGGDIQASSPNFTGQKWRVGIRNPFNINENVKILEISNEGVATSGNYIRGQHIYNPHDYEKPILEVTSITVIGPNVYEADRFATAAFAMGSEGINFIENLNGFEAYQIDNKGIATMTSGFNKYKAEPQQ